MMLLLLTPHSSLQTPKHNSIRNESKIKKAAKLCMPYYFTFDLMVCNPPNSKNCVSEGPEFQLLSVTNIVRNIEEKRCPTGGMLKYWILLTKIQPFIGGHN
jgi:hypothetical protein